MRLLVLLAVAYQAALDSLRLVLPALTSATESRGDGYFLPFHCVCVIWSWLHDSDAKLPECLLGFLLDAGPPSMVACSKAAYLPTSCSMNFATFLALISLLGAYSGHPVRSSCADMMYLYRP